MDVQLYRLCDELSGALILPMLVFSPWAFGTTEPWSIWYWLETRITFGWLGFGMLLAALACVVLRWFVPGGIQGSRRFVVLAWLALAGCLVEARFDYPFQIHSTLFLFLVICALLFGFSERSNGAGVEAPTRAGRMCATEIYAGVNGKSTILAPLSPATVWSLSSVPI